MLIIFFTHLWEIVSKFTKNPGGKIYASAMLADIMGKQSMFSQDPGFGKRSQYYFSDINVIKLDMTKAINTLKWISEIILHK